MINLSTLKLKIATPAGVVIFFYKKHKVMVLFE